MNVLGFPSVLECADLSALWYAATGRRKQDCGISLAATGRGFRERRQVAVLQREHTQNSNAITNSKRLRD